MFLERSISEIRENNLQLLESEKKSHKANFEKIQSSIVEERECLDIRCKNLKRENEKISNEIQELQELVKTTVDQSKETKEMVSQTQTHVESIINQNTELNLMIENERNLRAVEKCDIKRQIGSLIEQINGFQLPAVGFNSIQSVSSLSCKVQENENEINRLLSENIKYLDTYNDLQKKLEQFGKYKDSCSLDPKNTSTILARNENELHLSPEEMKKKLAESKNENEKLSNYIDNVLASIMDNCSHLLEKKS